MTVWRHFPVRPVAAPAHLSARSMSSIRSHGILESDRKTHQPLADAQFGARLGRQALMRRCGGVGDQALGIAEIVRNLDHLQCIGEAECALLAACDLEGDDVAVPACCAHRQIVLQVAREPRIMHAFSLARPSSHGVGASRMLAHAQIERLETFQHHPGIERAEARPGLAQEVGEMVGDERLIDKTTPPRQRP